MVLLHKAAHITVNTKCTAVCTCTRVDDNTTAWTPLPQQQSYNYMLSDSMFGCTMNFCECS